MFIRKKSFKNKDGTRRVYAEIVESNRIGGKPVSTTLLNLGRIDTPEGAKRFENLCRNFVKNSDELDILNPREDLRNESSKSYGQGIFEGQAW